MIWALSCTCGGAETMVRKKLRKYGYDGWMSIPIIQGKDKVLAELKAAAPIPEIESLILHVQQVSSFAIILGYKNNECLWADISKNDIASDVRAETIIKEFA